MMRIMHGAHTSVFDGAVTVEADGVHSDKYTQCTVNDSLFAGTCVYTSEVDDAFTLKDDGIHYNKHMLEYDCTYPLKMVCTHAERYRFMDVFTFMNDCESFIGTTYSSSYTLASTLSSSCLTMAGTAFPFSSSRTSSL